jgi:cysteine desulfurase
MYFDYSATTKCDEDVLDYFVTDFLLDDYFSDYTINFENKIKEILNTNLDVSFTSGSSESNNLVLKGIAKNFTKGEIISTRLEHSSIKESLKYLENKGFIIRHVPLIDGVVSLKDLDNMINDNTILVTIVSVNSEIGVLQPIDEIGKIVHKHNVLFHSDMTQSVGKVNIDLDNLDFVSFSAHKFFGLKGVGCLLCKPGVKLELFYGERGENFSLIKSMVFALEKELVGLNGKYDYVFSLSKKVKDSLVDNPNVLINSNNNCIPHILNISVKRFKPETFLHKLEMRDIYISTQSACSSDSSSSSVFALTNSLERAKSSVRISFSYKTTVEEVDKLIEVLGELL